MTSDSQIIALVAGTLVPILVGITAKLRAPSGLKSVLNAALSGVGGLLAQANLPGGFAWKAFFIAWAQVWVVSIATYAGLYKPTGIAGVVQKSTKTVGIG